MTDNGKEIAGLTGLRFHKNSGKVVGTRLMFPQLETSGGLCAVCLKDALCNIGKKARTGKALFPEPFGTAQFGAEKMMPSFQDIQIVPELYGEAIMFPNVDTEVKIGGFKSKVPVTVAAMGSTTVAFKHAKELSFQAAQAGIPFTIGENVIGTHGENGLREVIESYLKGFNGFGAMVVQGNVEDQRQDIFQKAKEFGAHAIELKLGQGAKQGLGGEIKVYDESEAERFKKLGYLMIKEEESKEKVVFQRHSSPGTISDSVLRETLVKYKELGIPIWAKVGIGSGIIRLIESLEKIKEEEHVPFKCLTIDGFGGGTGMSPWIIMNESSMPSAAVFSALKKKPSFDIVLAGNMSDGSDIAKALMLGASGVALGRCCLIAVNTPNGSFKNFVNALRDELQMFCATQRVDSVEKLKEKKKNLVALSKEASELFGLPLDLKNIL